MLWFSMYSTSIGSGEVNRLYNVLFNRLTSGELDMEEGIEPIQWYMS